MQDTLLEMARAIEADIGKQFEIYDADQMAGIDRLIRMGEYPDTIRTAWQLIDSGDVPAGTQLLTEREQVFVLRPGYKAINELSMGTLGTFIAQQMSAKAHSGFTGCPSFKEVSSGWWTDTREAAENARWHYLRDHVLPRWNSMTRAERDLQVKAALVLIDSDPVHNIR